MIKSCMGDAHSVKSSPTHVEPTTTTWGDEPDLETKHDQPNFSHRHGEPQAEPVVVQKLEKDIRDFNADEERLWEVALNAVDREEFYRSNVEKFNKDGHHLLELSAEDREVADNLMHVWHDAHKQNADKMILLSSCQDVEPRVWESVCDHVVMPIKYKAVIEDPEGHPKTRKGEITKATLALNKNRRVVHDDPDPQERNAHNVKVEALLQICKGVQYDVWESVRGTVGVLETAGFFSKVCELLKSCAYVDPEVWEDIRGLLAIEAGSDLGVVCHLCAACSHVEYETWQSARDTLRLEAGAEVFQVIKVLQACQNVEYQVWLDIRRILGFYMLEDDDHNVYTGMTEEGLYLMRTVAKTLRACNGVEYFVWKQVTDIVKNEIRNKLQNPQDPRQTMAYLASPSLVDLLIKLARACKNVEYMVFISAKEILGIDENFKMPKLIKILEACGDIEYYVWEDVRHLLDIQPPKFKDVKPDLQKDFEKMMKSASSFGNDTQVKAALEQKHKTTMKIIDPEHPPVAFSFVIEILISCKHIKFDIWGEVEDNELKVGNKGGRFHRRGALREEGFMGEAAEAFVGGGKKAGHNKMHEGHLNNGVNVAPVKELLAACQHVELDVFREAKKKFEFNLGADWDHEEFIQVLTACQKVKYRVFKDGNDTVESVRLAADMSKQSVVREAINGNDVRQLDPFRGQMEGWATSDLGTSAKQLTKSKGSGDGLVAAKQMQRGVAHTPMKIWDQNVIDSHTAWTTLQDKVSQGDRSIMRYVHSDFSGTQATTSYRPLPRDTCWGGIFGAGAADDVDEEDQLLVRYNEDDITHSGDWDGWTVLHRAAKGNDDISYQIIGNLITKGADPNASDPIHGATALHFAASKANEKCVQVLLSKDADINARVVQSGNTALHRAAENGSPSIINLLIKNNIDINARNWFGNTALHVAAKKGHSKAVKALLDGLAETNCRNAEGKTAEQLAEDNNHKKIVDMIGETFDFRVPMLCSIRFVPCK